MKGTRLYLIVQTALCVLLMVLLAASAIELYREGTAHRAEKPLEWIYTRGKAAEGFVSVAPLFLLFLGLTAAGFFFGPAQQVAVQEKDTTAGAVKINQELLASHSLLPAKAVKRMRAALILAAVVFIAAGVLNGSARDVFYKAVKICTECIGLG